MAAVAVRILEGENAGDIKVLRLGFQHRNTMGDNFSDGTLAKAPAAGKRGLVSGANAMGEPFLANRAGHRGYSFASWAYLGPAARASSA